MFTPRRLILALKTAVAAAVAWFFAPLVPFADASLGVVLRPGWDVAAQLQWHGALYDSAIPLLNDAATLTLSSAWHAKGGWTLRAGLVEDAIAKHAQDVTIFLSLTL